MHADGVVDDEFQPRQANPGVGDLGKVERHLRVANVEHDLDRAVRHLAPRHLADLGLQQAVVDKAGVTLGADHGHQRAIGQLLGRVATTHHRRDAQFAGDDRGMAGAPAAVGDDCPGPLHHRLPVRVGHVTDQHIAGLHQVHLVKRLDHPHRAGADLLANRPALDQHGAAAFELVAVLGLVLGLALDRLGPGLQDVELAVDAVLAPFDVHRPAVVGLDHQGVAGQLDHVVVAQRVAVALFGRGVGGRDQAAGGGAFCLGRKAHADQLGA